MKLWQIMGELQTIFSPKIAEEWDNVGLLVGDNTREINKVLFCLDVTEKAVQKAVDNNVDLIISHHPVIFSGLKKITNETVHGRKILKLIENKIAVYSIHTNSDFAINGLNDFIMDKLNLDGEKVIFNEHEFEDYNPIKDKMEHVHGGLARIKILNENLKLEVLVLGVDYSMVKDLDDSKIHFVGGSTEFDLRNYDRKNRATAEIKLGYEHISGITATFRFRKNKDITSSGFGLGYKF